MSGINAGVNASYGSESGNVNQNTTSSGTSGSMTDFTTMLRELINASANSKRTDYTALPAYALQGMQRDYEQSVDSAAIAKDFLTSFLQQGTGHRSQGSARSREFAGAIDQLFNSQIARARTGDASQTGVARQGFREGEALAAAQRDALGLSFGAANSLLTHANPHAGLALIGSFAPRVSDTVQTSQQSKDSTTTGTSKTDAWNKNRSNSNTQSDSSSWGVGGGLGCCFIFLEAYNGTLPWWVRHCRDAFVTDDRRAGYNALASHVVPLMKKKPWARRLVNWTMVKPLTAFGGAICGVKGYGAGWLLAPIVAFWFWAFGKIGRS